MCSMMPGMRVVEWLVGRGRDDGGGSEVGREGKAEWCVGGIEKGWKGGGREGKEIGKVPIGVCVGRTCW